eukprot:TRINITY_DN9016_c0_g1_i1.p1 TRINITY_DN9016_c0_g1~~TRINITY_DN9016_c0_g1_i1.p1  ORF type:complete len:875 (+),score=244.15 TRINITY_DN9016_c0_g1_i1:73-2697(+)
MAADQQSPSAFRDAAPEPDADPEKRWLDVTLSPRPLQLNGAASSGAPPSAEAGDPRTPVSDNEQLASSGSLRGAARSKLAKLRRGVRLRMRAMQAIVEVDSKDIDSQRGSLAMGEFDDGQPEARVAPLAAHLVKWQMGVPTLLPDSRWRRWWGLILIFCSGLHGFIVPLLIADSVEFAYVAEMHLLLSAVWFVDMLIRANTAFVRDGHLVTSHKEVHWHYFRSGLLLDLVYSVPFDVMGFWAEVGTGVLKLLCCCRLARLLLVNKTFARSNIPVMTPPYVLFNFVYAPRVVFTFWAALGLHLMVVIKILVRDADHEDDDRYDLALFWVWNLLTTSPAPLTLHSGRQRVFCFILMICGVFFQGVIIGKLSFEFLRRSIAEQNVEVMRSTLMIIEQYNVPKALQQEVLSLQWHSLQSSLSAISRSEVLCSLPPVMRNEIMMYMKIDFINKVPMFSGATHRTKVLLAGSLQQMFVEPNETIIKQGDVGEDMYFILHGYCEVVLSGAGVVGQLTKGQFFGEVALLTREPRGATIRALTYCDCLRLTKSDFDEVCVGDTEFHQKIAKEAEERASKQQQKEVVRRISEAVSENHSLHRRMTMASGRTQTTTAEDDDGSIVIEPPPNPLTTRPDKAEKISLVRHVASFALWKSKKKEGGLADALKELDEKRRQNGPEIARQHSGLSVKPLRKSLRPAHSLPLRRATGRSDRTRRISTDTDDDSSLMRSECSPRQESGPITMDERRPSPAHATTTPTHETPPPSDASWQADCPVPRLPPDACEGLLRKDILTPTNDPLRDMERRITREFRRVVNEAVSELKLNQMDIRETLSEIQLVCEADVRSRVERESTKPTPSVGSTQPGSWFLERVPSQLQMLNAGRL